MRARLLLPLIAVVMTALFPAAARAQVHREDLIRRAFQSAAFTMMMAHAEDGFYDGLSAGEKQAFAQILWLAHVNDLQRWLRAQGVHDFGAGANHSFVYVMSDDQGVRMDLNAQIDLVFSDNEALFVLKPGESPRTAATSTNPQEPVYVNARKIERADFQLTYAEAVGLAVHEYGNKIPRPTEPAQLARLQNEIDNVAARLQAFVERNTRVLPVPDGRVTVTAFEPPRSNFDEFIEMSLTRPEGSAPGTPSRLHITGDQGFAAFYETAAGAVDLTDSLRAQLATSTFTRPPEDANFDWRILRWDMAHSFRAVETATGFTLAMNLDRRYAFIPFAHAKSPDPRADRPWRRNAFGFTPKAADMGHFEFRIDTRQGAEVTGFRRTITVISDPSVPVAKGGQEWRGRDLVLTYRLPETHRIPGHLGGGIPVRPFLQLRSGTENSEVEGRKVGRDLFEFTLKNAASAAGSVEVRGLQIADATKPSPELVLAQTLRVQLLLPPEAAPISLPRPARPGDFALKTVQLWDGTRWVSLRRAGPVPKGSSLRFVFDSNSELQSLILQQSHVNQVRIDLQTSSTPDLTMVNNLNEANARSLTIGASALKQTLIGDKLIVDWTVDRDFKLSETYVDELDPRQVLRMLQAANHPISEAPAWAKQVVTIGVQPQRVINAIIATNRDLQNARIDRAQVFRFDRAETGPAPDFRAKAPKAAPVSCGKVW